MAKSSTPNLRSLPAADIKFVSPMLALTVAAVPEGRGWQYQVVAKKIDSWYEPGQRSGAWVKDRTIRGQELVIGDYLPGAYGFDSLLVGYYEGQKLIFIAKIRNGFTPALKREIKRRMVPLETGRCPFANLPEPKDARRGEALTTEVMKKCRWLKPRLVARIGFTDWTH